MKINLNPAALVKYKNTFLNIAVSIIFLIIANGIYKSQNLTAVKLGKDREVEIKKNAALAAISALEKKVGLYKNFLNKKDLSSIINNISNIANESQIKIISIRPQNEKDQGDYIKYPFSLSITAKDYHQLGLFIAKLESSPDIYIVESIAVRPRAAEARPSKQAEKVSAELTLSTVLLKG
ncbi:hypothetical protein D4Q80_02845 [bacterium]|nr:MAG: hypothetical protein D4Q80_02845 [bacterium]